MNNNKNIIKYKTMLFRLLSAKRAKANNFKPCNVEFYQPEDQTLIDDYQLSFWQKKHEEKNT